jgi:hypothetical protein
MIGDVLQAREPLVDVDAMLGNTSANVEVGGGEGNVVSASIDGLAGIDADVDVTTGGDLAAIDVDAAAKIGTGIDVDGHVGGGIAVDADIGLDGALINAAASVDAFAGSLIGADSLGDCGCSDSSTSMDAAGDSVGAGIVASLGIPDIGLGSPLSLSSLDLSSVDLFCDQA